VGDIDFKTIYATENSNKFQKTRFWKEKSLEAVVTLGPMAQATLVNIISMVEFDPSTFDKS
jgi:hypothetical protein